MSLYLQQLQDLGNYIQTSRVLASQEVKAFAQALVTNKLGPLTARHGASGAHCAVMELTVHLAAVLLCGTNAILSPLQQLAFKPGNMQVCIMSRQLLSFSAPHASHFVLSQSNFSLWCYREPSCPPCQRTCWQWLNKLWGLCSGTVSQRQNNYSHKLK